MTIHCIVLSGGTGRRMGQEQPKQFLELAGRPILLHSLDACLRFQAAQSPGGACVVVAPAEYIEETRRLLGERPVRVVVGGSSRHASTLCGLAALPDIAAADLVFIHDAARPLLDAGELERLAAIFAEQAGVDIASLAAPVTETLVVGSGPGRPLDAPVDRTRYFAVKTPQALRGRVLATLRNAPGAPEEFTDLLTWGAAAGLRGWLVEAGPHNLKLTHAADLPYLEHLLRLRAAR